MRHRPADGWRGWQHRTRWRYRHHQRRSVFAVRAVWGCRRPPSEPAWGL